METFLTVVGMFSFGSVVGYVWGHWNGWCEGREERQEELLHD